VSKQRDMTLTGLTESEITLEMEHWLVQNNILIT